MTLLKTIIPYFQRNLISVSIKDIWLSQIPFTHSELLNATSGSRHGGQWICTYK